MNSTTTVSVKILDKEYQVSCKQDEVDALTASARYLDQQMRQIRDEVVTFQMPGSIIPGFSRKAVQIAKAGIYDLRIHHDDIVAPLLRQWGVFELEGLDAEGEKAREELAEAVAALDGAASRFVEQRDAAEAKRAARRQG